MKANTSHTEHSFLAHAQNTSQPALLQHSMIGLQRIRSSEGQNEADPTQGRDGQVMHAIPLLPTVRLCMRHGNVKVLQPPVLTVACMMVAAYCLWASSQSLPSILLKLIPAPSPNKAAPASAQPCQHVSSLSLQKWLQKSPRPPGHTVISQLPGCLLSRCPPDRPLPLLPPSPPSSPTKGPGPPCLLLCPCPCPCCTRSCT
jgi:hypothetical protein